VKLYIKEDIKNIRETKPVVHHITNFVVMNDCANITLALGALPVMAHALEEVEEMTSISQALNLNIGTLTDEWIKAMIKAGKKANELNISVVFDPVGAGATRFRTQCAVDILNEVNISIIKGNGAEIASLYGVKSEVKGVEAGKIEADMNDVVKNFAKKTQSVVVATGKDDYISDGKRTCMLEGKGSKMLSTITGSGCMLGSVISAFSCVQRDHFLASIEGLLFFEKASEYASKKSRLPASFKVALLDEIYRMNGTETEEWT
jgi:hydroxyethylthiazole kinase